MDKTDLQTARRPWLLWLSVAADAVILPLLLLVNHFSRPCGDGLCDFLFVWAILLIFLFFAFVFAVAGLLRRERPLWIVLFHVPLLGVVGVLVGLWG